MPYIARKCVKFDRDYLIGELIPDEAVSPGRAADLAAMGLIAPLTAQEPEGATESTGEGNTHDDGPEPEVEPTDGQEDQKKAKAKK